MNRVVALLAVLVTVACGSSSNYAGAAAAAGLGVGAAGINRAITKDCWGQCLNGLVCDHNRGICVERAPCGGRCGPDERCEESGAFARCTSLVRGGSTLLDPGDAGPTYAGGVETDADGG